MFDNAHTMQSIRKKKKCGAFAEFYGDHDLSSTLSSTTGSGRSSRRQDDSPRYLLSEDLVTTGVQYFGGMGPISRKALCKILDEIAAKHVSYGAKSVLLERSKCGSRAVGGTMRGEV